MADVLGQERSQLVITFEDSNGETVNFNISNPRYDVEEEAIRAIAEHIIEHNYFKTSKGSDYAKMVKAKVVASETDRFDLTV